MGLVAAILHGVCTAIIWWCLRSALAVHSFQRWALRSARRLRGSLKRLLRRWLAERRHPVQRRGRRAWNRTPERVEEELVRLHVEQPQLGAGQLMRLARRVLGLHTSRETVRQILIRRQELVVELEQERRRRRRSICVSRPGMLWGIDLTLLWVLGFWPVWVVGIVDYCGSKLVAFERVSLPTSERVVQVVERAIDAYGAPRQLLSDRGGVFTSAAFEAMCVGQGVRHALIRPAHPWTNGRIERVFRTFKEEVVRRYVWIFAGVGQIDRYCEEFRRWYDRDRPHSGNGGRTPDEVYFRRELQIRPLERVAYFDGQLRWYRFGPAG